MFACPVLLLLAACSSAPHRPVQIAAIPAEAAPVGDETTDTPGSRYDSLIARYAEENGVPLPLAHAVIRQESGYNPRARGGSAVGLMQIKPATARGIGYRGSTAGLYDPETNLEWGMKYLGGAYKLGGGDTCGTALRYQGGHRATRMSASTRRYCAELKRKVAQTEGESPAHSQHAPQGASAIRILMANHRNRPRLAIAALAVLAMCGAATAQQCAGSGGFRSWLEEFKAEAAAQGISAEAIGELDRVRYDQKVIDSDRRQAVFSQSFLEFAGRMVADYRMKQGRQLLKKYADIFDRIEAEYGVPGPVLVAFWGLETDFGANLGDTPTLQALATLSYDCRRPELFRGHLLAALKLLDNGDLAPRDLKGAWAGEIGQMQFIPTEYLEKAVDYDGDGRRNLVRSVPDVLASSANLLREHGWQPGEPWLQEVSVPSELAWEQADLSIRLPRSEWAAAGVTKADGSPLPADGAEAALLLPMGRRGPAFLAYRNFDVYTDWNKSLVYATTAAYFATRLAGTPPVQHGRAQALSRKEIISLQKRLEALGYDVGGADGTLGAQTRAAVKQVQLQLGLPADSYPTAELLQALLRS
jgi:lytic murein transglycosylase